MPSNYYFAFQWKKSTGAWGFANAEVYMPSMTVKDLHTARKVLCEKEGYESITIFNVMSIDMEDQ